MMNYPSPEHNKNNAKIGLDKKIFKENKFEPHEAEQLIDAVAHVETPFAQQILKRFAQRYYKEE